MQLSYVQLSAVIRSGSRSDKGGVLGIEICSYRLLQNPRLSESPVTPPLGQYDRWVRDLLLLVLVLPGVANSTWAIGGFSPMPVSYFWKKLGGELVLSFFKTGKSGVKFLLWNASFSASCGGIATDASWKILQPELYEGG